MILSALLAAVTMATPASVSIKPDCTEGIRAPKSSSKLLVYRPYSLQTKLENVARASIFVHGMNRDPDDHFRTSLAARFLTNTLNDTVVVVQRLASNNSAPGNSGFFPQ